MTIHFEDTISRRSFLRNAALAGAGAATLGSLGSFSAHAAMAKELRLLFAGGTWQEWYSNTFAVPFTEAHGTKFIWRKGLSHEPIVIAQRKRPQWDLIHGNQEMATQLGAMNLLVKWEDDRIPNLANVHPSFRYEFLAGKIHTPYGLAVNTKRITREINSWEDLWDPAFKGKVAFPVWKWMGEEVFHYINKLAGGAEDNIDPGIAKMAALFKDNECQLIENVEHTHQNLLAEEVWICPHFGARTEKAAAAGAPVEFILPKEGGMSWIFNTGIIAGRPDESREVAEQFVGATLDAENQIAFSRLTGYPPTNREAQNNLPDDMQNIYYSDEQLANLGAAQRNFDYLTMFAYKDQYTERWKKEVLAA